METYFDFALIILVTVGLNTTAQYFLKQRWNLGLGYGIPALYMMIFIWNHSKPFELLRDFNRAYYPAGRLIVEHPSSLYDWMGYANGEFGFVNIPIIALLFTPLSFSAQVIAQMSMIILSILAIVATYYLLVGLARLTGWKKLVLAGLFFINGPLYYSLREGNLTHFTLLLLCLALICIKSRRDIWLGILLAIGTLIKIPLFLLGMYYLFRGRWRVILGFSAGILVIVGASVLLFGVDLHRVWFEQCILSSLDKPLGAYNVQSVDGFLVRLLTDNPLTNAQPVEISWNFKIIRYILISFLMGSVIWIFWRSKAPLTPEVENLEFSIILCLALVTSTISWTHYYLFLLLPLGLYLGNQLAIPRDKMRWGWVTPSTLLISPPVRPIKGWRAADPILNFWYHNLFVSHYFFGCLLLMAILLAARWHISQRPQLSYSLPAFRRPVLKELRRQGEQEEQGRGE